ncbi:hypothetical protein O9H85_06685 [Paenibacillus filicis]|uniref:N-acetyltransferase domain-containing protein n=1 Tax=Paenibacillus gyeongsangnamensis TaxID=3388067 RepID=A0ABT4Q5H6_9BACL|nr:hypothetical protein [Paenibacillus filicis]MCZ8512117.1 hypothetical protein [Paenibacillus filicis]
MSELVLRPDIRTSGGEVCDIVYRDQFVGTLTLVYREGDKMAGALQLETEVLSEREKDVVCDHVHQYVQGLIDAMRLKECEVMVTFSNYDHVIASEGSSVDPRMPGVDVEEDLDYESDWIDYDTRFEDEPGEQDVYTLTGLDLAVTSETRNTVEYRIYEGEHWIADAFVRIDGREVTGFVDWSVEPTEEEMDETADLLAGDLEDREVVSFVIDMKLDGDILETIELTHDDLLEDAADFDSEVPGEKYNVILARDDGDVLSYEIYQPSRSGLPIGTATVDISDKQLSGFVDFREPGSAGDREAIAMMLMQELEKEKDYDLINLSMMHKNRLIEEMFFETEQLH